MAAPPARAARLSEAASGSRFALQGEGEALRRVAGLCGVAVPAAVNRADTSPAGRALLRLGPDEYLFLVEGDDHASLAAQLDAALTVEPASLVDVSDRQIGLRLDGEGAALALNAGVPLDLDIEAFPIAMATRTLFEKAEIVLWRVGADSFRIEVARSFAPYLRALIDLALRENAAAP